MGVRVSLILSPPYLPSHPIPQGCPSAPALSALFHAANLGWSSISQMVIYMFPRYSLKSVQDSKTDTDVKNRLLDSVGEGEGGMIWEKWSLYNWHMNFAIVASLAW